MRQFFFRSSVIISAVFLFFACQESDTVTTVQFREHKLDLTFNVPDHQLTAIDSGTFFIHKGWNVFNVYSDARVTDFKLDEQAVTFYHATAEDSAGLPENLLENIPEDLAFDDHQLIAFKANYSGESDFVLNYNTIYKDKVDNVRFSRENVGREVSGTILDKGAFLSGSALFYPQGKDDLLQFKLTVDIPATWESICDGNQLASTVSGDRKIQTWKNPYLSDGLTFMAAPYVTRSATAGEATVFCYFFEADTNLFDTYLSATTDYINMYSDLIGPYPYERFTVAENFFPTGYGMPGWTLLGQQVLRLPFIVRTSLGHEVLHNWWGNSVYVDYERGNWCEGATVYGADYRYKEMQSADAAKDYRKDILKQYVSYVTPENDFPLREFRSRTSPETRTIGYNKTMMVYHMIRNIIGDDAFFDAWKLIYQRHRGEKISWEEWIDAFEETSDQSLDYIIPQWVDQTGAAELAFETGSINMQGDVKAVPVTVTEKSGIFPQMQIPLQFSGDLTVDTTIVMTKGNVSTTLSVPAGVNTVTLDPDFELFRRLYPEEIEPIVAAVLGAENKEFWSFVDGAEPNHNFQLFGNNLMDLSAEDASVKIQKISATNRPHSSTTPILLNPYELPDYLDEFVTLSSDIIQINGTEFPLPGHTFIFAGKSWYGSDHCLVVYSENFDDLERLGQLIPHYGKYSYLVFEGTHNIAKGQWPVSASPLRREI